VTNDPAPDARPSSLHKRLTVALASSADRSRLADVIVGDPGSAGKGPSGVLGYEDLAQAAGGYARERAEDRRALRSRLDGVAARTMHDCDTARHQLEHLQGWQRTIVDGATWATQLHADLPQHLDAVEAVRRALDERRAEQRAAQQDLDRVLEQRTAAAAAIEEADRELSEMAGSGMDESALRRELEAAGQSVRDAATDHGAALARLEELQIEVTGLEVRRDATRPMAERRDAPREAPGVAAVRAALSALQAVTIDGDVDPDAMELVHALRDLHADFREVGGPLQSVSELELDTARRRVAAAAERLAALDAVASATTIAPDARAALDAAHAEVLAAEEQIVGRRRVTAAARQRLDAAHSAERALLAQYGFGGYLDVVLSGGRAGAADPARPAAERDYFEATLALEDLERSTYTSPELTHLRSERARLLGLAHDLLGVDPADEVEALLLSHPPASPALRTALVEALAAADVRPVGVSLESAAVAFLEEHPQPEPADPGVELRPDERRIELAAIDARSAAVEGELDAAQAEVDRTGEALQLAQTSVEAFEGELTVRAGEDVQRMKRFAAAEQLRAQVDAVAATLQRAEQGARRDLETADQAVIAAESAFEQTSSDVSDLAWQARKLAEELPIDSRPTGDPLRTLPLLVERLQAHAEVLQPEIDKAEAAVAAAADQLEDAMAACRLANAGGDGAQPEDVTAALGDLLAQPGDHLLVLDEPFVGVDQAARAALLDIVRAASVKRPLVLLTEDPEVLGWAIELPAEDAAAFPADALLARFRRSNHGLNPPLPGADGAGVLDPAPDPTHDSAPPDVDITTSTTIDTDQEASPTARRWAGQR
jgi:hypothetical protein